MQHLGGICCPICLEYLVKPATTACGHTFCQLCLQEYFLFLNYCPVCEQDIRQKKLLSSKVLGQFIENFIAKQHQEQYEEYLEKVKKAKQWIKEKEVKNFAAGMKVDIRDHNYVWRQAIIVRVISRIGEACKYLKVKTLDSDLKFEDDLKANSSRLAKYGFYTKRSDIPKYINPQKIEKTIKN